MEGSRFCIAQDTHIFLSLGQKKVPAVSQPFLSMLLFRSSSTQSYCSNRTLRSLRLFFKAVNCSIAKCSANRDQVAWKGAKNDYSNLEAGLTRVAVFFFLFFA